MLNAELIQKLKQVNVSVDETKASERLKQAYGALSRADKDRLISLTGQNRHSLYRAERTGLITAKLLLPAAFVCNVSPEWLTGESDEQGEFTKERMISFLAKHGYKKLVEELEEQKVEKKKRRAGRKPKNQTESVQAEEAVETMPEAEAAVESEESCGCEESCDCESEGYCVSLQFQLGEKHQEFLDNLDVEQAILLLRALSIRAACNEDDAKIYDVVKRCLLN